MNALSQKSRWTSLFSSTKGAIGRFSLRLKWVSKNISNSIWYDTSSYSINNYFTPFQDKRQNIYQPYTYTVPNIKRSRETTMTKTGAWNRWEDHWLCSLVIYILNVMNTVTPHGIDHLQVILIIQTIKMSIRFAVAWAVHKMFWLREAMENLWLKILDIIGHMFYWKCMQQSSFDRSNQIFSCTRSNWNCYKWGITAVHKMSQLKLLTINFHYNPASIEKIFFEIYGKFK